VPIAPQIWVPSGARLLYHLTMSSLTATQVTAIATGVLAFFALVTSFFAWRAFTKQSTEVALLQEQAERDAQQRRRAQASQVFTWVEILPDKKTSQGLTWTAIRIRNSSEQPVYDLSISWKEAERVAGLPVLMPGGEKALQHGLPDEVINGSTPVSLELRDSAGICWQMNSWGKLMEVPCRPPIRSVGEWLSW
jgi:hypothetical protein